MTCKCSMCYLRMARKDVNTLCGKHEVTVPEERGLRSWYVSGAFDRLYVRRLARLATQEDAIVLVDWLLGNDMAFPEYRVSSTHVRALWFANSERLKKAEAAKARYHRKTEKVIEDMADNPYLRITYPTPIYKRWRSVCEKWTVPKGAPTFVLEWLPKINAFE